MVINDWISVSPDNGCGEKTVTITLGKNNTGSSRIYKIPVYFDDGSIKYITVNQPACETTLTVTPSSISFGSAGGSSTIIIESTADWEISGVPDWATMSETSGTSGKTTVTVTIIKNTEASRAGTIIVTSGGKTASVNVMQSGAVVDCPTYATASQTYFDFPSSGGTTTFTVESDGNYYLTLGDVSEKGITITPTGDQLAGTTTFTITCEAGSFYMTNFGIKSSCDHTDLQPMTYFTIRRNS